jgi:hypothetical protein
MTIDRSCHLVRMPSNYVDDFRSAAVTAGVPGDEVENWLDSVHLYVHLSLAGKPGFAAPGSVAGRKGGLPLLPDDVPWPTDSSGRPLPFHALVDCAALPRAQECDSQAPTNGYLLFFVNFDGTMAVEASLEEEQDATQLIYVPAGVPVRERPVPVVDGEPALTPFPAVPLTAAIGFGAGESFEEEDDPAGPLPHWNDLKEIALKVFSYGGFGDRDLEIGSSPMTPQTDPLDFISGHRFSEEGDPDDVRQQWVALAQFGSEDPIETFTIARFFIRRDDLAAGDFTRVLSCSEFME